MQKILASNFVVLKLNATYSINPGLEAPQRSLHDVLEKFESKIMTRIKIIWPFIGRI